MKTTIISIIILLLSGSTAFAADKWNTVDKALKKYIVELEKERTNDQIRM